MKTRDWARFGHSCRRVLFVAWAVVLASAFAPIAEAGKPDRSRSREFDRGTVIPDCDGRIAELLLQYDPELRFDLSRLYRDIFVAFPPDVRVRVLCPDEDAAAEFLSTWGRIAALGDREVEVIDVGMPISIWARDRCIARQPRSLKGRVASYVPTLDSSYGAERRNDVRVQGLLNAGGFSPEVRTSPLIIEGGNIVANSRHVFVGANVFDENSLRTSRANVHRELRRMFGQPFVLVGDRSGVVPWCHIDMYLTPLTIKTISVASPSLGAQLLSKYIEETGDDSENTWIQACFGDSVHDDILDSIADRLRRRGYDVVRTPALINKGQEWMVTYNNVLMERRGGVTVVYMPVYGIPSLDLAAEAIYRGLNCDVRTVDVSGIFILGGALRCVANVTERSPDGNFSRWKIASTGEFPRFFRIGSSEEIPTEALDWMDMDGSALLRCAPDEWESDEQRETLWFEQDVPDTD